MQRLTWLLPLLAAPLGCTQILGLRDVTVEHHVGGRLRGLWDGADGVALQLKTDAINTLLTVSANGPFQFPELLAPGVSYTVTVAANPVQHTCVIDAGGNGRVADAEVTTLSIACSGPAMSVALSGPWGWNFDPTQETQTFAGSIATQQVSVTVSGSSLRSADLNGMATTLGKTTAPIALPLGERVVSLTLSASGGLSKTYQLVFHRGASVLDQLAYGKASNSGGGDRFGWSVALSGDTLAVGAPQEDSAATGVNGNQADNSAGDAGAVYVFVREGTTWSQQAYLKASNAGAGDQFGWSIALSGDVLAVGAPEEDSAAMGINGNQADNSAGDAGAVYMFVRQDTTWSQQAYLKASNTEAGDEFGTSVALSGDTLAVGAPPEDSAATGVNSNQADNSTPSAGAVYIFIHQGIAWTQQAYLKASNAGTGDGFGRSIALSGDTLAVGAPGEASAAIGANGNQTDNSASSAGAAYVFVRQGATWAQQAYLKASNTGSLDFFGYVVALSGDTLAVSAYGEDSSATGVNGNQTDNSARTAGAVYVFVRQGTTWAQQAYVKASNTEGNHSFGWPVALSGDTLAVAATGERSAATGVNGNQADRSRDSSGAVYVFVRQDTTWSQKIYLKASNTDAVDVFGSSVALSGDTLAVGAIGEDSAATGINGNQADNSASSAGAVYILR